MLANNNLKICRKLVRRDFSFHKTKNFILILAAALVTALYSFVFLLGSAVEGAFLLNYQYTYGSTSHILYTGLTEHQAALLSQHPNVKSAVRLSTVGTLSDPMLGQRSVKLAVTDRDYAQTVLSIPTTGRLPEQPGEIALDEFTMGSLGVLQEIGAPVTLEWTDAAGNTHTDAFTLCGWWASPTNFTEACAWITADTAANLMPDYDSENAANLTLGVTLHQPRDLETQAAQILTDQGLPELAFDTLEDLWRFQLEGTGISLEDFQHGAVSLSETPINPGPVFKTPSGKIEVLFTPWEEAGIPSLRPYVSPARPGPEEFRLIVGRHACHTHSHTQNNPLLHDKLPVNEAWIAPERGQALGLADGDTAVMRAASGYSGQIRVRLVSGMHPEALFMLHGFGHSLPVESRARGLGLGDQHFMSGGLTQEDELAHGLALQAHFVRLTPCDTSAKDN